MFARWTDIDNEFFDNEFTNKDKISRGWDFGLKSTTKTFNIFIDWETLGIELQDNIFDKEFDRYWFCDEQIFSQSTPSKHKIGIFIDFESHFTIE